MRSAGVGPRLRKSRLVFNRGHSARRTPRTASARPRPASDWSMSRPRPGSRMCIARRLGASSPLGPIEAEELLLSDTERPSDHLPPDRHHHLVVSTHHHVTYIPWTEGDHVGSSHMPDAVIQDAIAAT